MLSFISALYNEESEIVDLLEHVEPYVDGIYLADDGSTDNTKLLLLTYPRDIERITFTTMEHTGLPETVKNEALKMVPDDSWVLMLDADERFAPGVLDQLAAWYRFVDKQYNQDNITHVYFRQVEIIDGQPVREFQKSKLFKKDSIIFSTGIHEDDRFLGEGLYKPEWLVYHRKTSQKQRLREMEYLETYDKLLQEGKIDEGRRQWLRGLHHYVT